MNAQHIPPTDSIWKRYPWLAWLVVLAIIIGLYFLYDRWLETI